MLHDNGKEMLLNVLGECIFHVSDDRNSVGRMKDELGKHGITGSRVESVLGNVRTLEEADIRELVLFTEQVHLITEIGRMNPLEWFTENEIETSKQFDKRLFNDISENAITQVIFEQASIVENDVYSTIIDISTISDLLDAQILNYNFDYQRQPKKRKGSANPVATVYKKNVKEIKNLLLKQELVSTTIAFNAPSGSSETGEEVAFDSETGLLYISEGVRLDVLDGYHRCLASVQAYKENPNLKFKFMLRVSNYTTREGQLYVAQLAKSTPIPKSRIESLEAKRHADKVVRRLKADSELKNRISESHSYTPSAGELVSYNVITDAIDREFPMKTTMDEREVEKYLNEFFVYLIGSYPDEFLYNSKDNNSLMKYNKMFAGYITLAARMQKEEIELDKLKNILDSIDFSRDNPLWKEIDLITSDGRISGSYDERKIVKHFRKLKI